MKVTEEDGGHTEDSFAAIKLYNALKKAGYKPFFSEEEMGERTGADYEALILYALHKAPCMLIVCSDAKYLETKWVRNEFTRFYAMLADEEKERDSITIAYKGKVVERLPGVKGRIHSFLSMGAVDGPGLRYVVFLQGCPLRCACCHNPDTWNAAGGTEYTVEDVLRRVRRCKPYIYESGGVTVTGGEPLAQPVFTAALLKALRAEGYHTALDTSGAGALAAAREVLAHTDLVLADLKFSPSLTAFTPFSLPSR